MVSSRRFGLIGSGGSEVQLLLERVDSGDYHLKFIARLVDFFVASSDEALPLLVEGVEVISQSRNVD